MKSIVGLSSLAVLCVIGTGLAFQQQQGASPPPPWAYGFATPPSGDAGVQPAGRAGGGGGG
ncbi:MAG TPA: hypothetical protein VIP11_23605, partial [Gemmatimonadaceae bacterium]